MKKIIIDAVTGTDDAVAITHLLLQDNLDILGISAVHGNQPVSCTSKNALKLVDFMGRDIDVYKGCRESLVRDILPGREHNPLMQKVRAERDGKPVYIHNPDIDSLPDTKKALKTENAVSFIVRTLNETKEPISIVALGPLTNIAAALILDKTIVRNIDKIYIMGGQITIGNRTPVAEANFYDDPEAAHIVLTSGANCIVTPIEPSISVQFDEEMFDKLAKIGNKVSEFIKTESYGFIDRMSYLGIYPEGAKSCGMCDWTAVLPLIDESLVLESEDVICQVEVSGGFADGMLLVDRRRFAKGDKTVKIIKKFDGKRAIAKFLADIEKFK